MTRQRASERPHTDRLPERDLTRHGAKANWRPRRHPLSACLSAAPVGWPHQGRTAHRTYMYALFGGMAGYGSSKLTVVAMTAQMHHTTARATEIASHTMRHHADACQWSKGHLSDARQLANGQWVDIVRRKPPWEAAPECVFLHLLCLTPLTRRWVRGIEGGRTRIDRLARTEPGSTQTDRDHRP